MCAGGNTAGMGAVSEDQGRRSDVDMPGSPVTRRTDNCIVFPGCIGSDGSAGWEIRPTRGNAMRCDAIRVLDWLDWHLSDAPLRMGVL
jgi:hypothetical protein